ncbi:MAG: hypothetical protein E7045_06510 [Lentisphaerae bacterium]|nr:hypothetical protein [Lentisphaerota bacterium]
MSIPCLHLTDLWLADGTGAPLKKSELLISGGVVSAVGKEDIGAGAGVKISCRNQIVSPGFIDVHGHSDISILSHPDAVLARTSQGVTCEIAGNCGLSAFPVTQVNRSHLEELYARYNIPFDWQSSAELRQLARQKVSACDIEYLSGHNTLRAAVSGYGNDELGEPEIKRMCALLDAELDSGVLGLSLGLLYVPGKFASESELYSLFKTVAAHNKIVTCHLKSEGKKLIESIEEMIYLARVSGLKKLHISHFKTAGKDNFHKLGKAFELFEEASQYGVDITFDRYPYTQSMTQLSLILPDEWSDIDDVTITEKLQDNECCREVISELQKLRSDDYWKSVTLVNSPLPKYRPFCGMTLDKLGENPAECAVEILRYNSPGATAAFSGMSKENMVKIITDPRCMPGSDGTALPPGGEFGYDHPRSYGAVARFIRLLLDNGIKIEETVRRATGLPAQVFGLTNRGVIKKGVPADITVFDPDEIDGNSTFASPSAPAAGVSMLFKEGRRVL